MDVLIPQIFLYFGFKYCSMICLRSSIVPVWLAVIIRIACVMAMAALLYLLFEFFDVI